MSCPLFRCSHSPVVVLQATDSHRTPSHVAQQSNRRSQASSGHSTAKCAKSSCRFERTLPSTTSTRTSLAGRQTGASTYRKRGESVAEMRSPRFVRFRARSGDGARSVFTVFWSEAGIRTHWCGLGRISVRLPDCFGCGLGRVGSVSASGCRRGTLVLSCVGARDALTNPRPRTSSCM